MPVAAVFRSTHRDDANLNVRLGATGNDSNILKTMSHHAVAGGTRTTNIYAKQYLSRHAAQLTQRVLVTAGVVALLNDLLDEVKGARPLVQAVQVLRVAVAVAVTRIIRALIEDGLAGDLPTTQGGNNEPNAKN